MQTYPKAFLQAAVLLAVLVSMSSSYAEVLPSLKIETWRDKLDEKTWQASQDRLAAEALRRDALILPADRDMLDVVLRRTRALLNDITDRLPAGRLKIETVQLSQLEGLNGSTALTDPARLDIYKDACRLRRVIALANPLLDFDRIVFLKHHRALYEHMVDQFYGFHAKPGGGVFVIEAPFGEKPVIKDLLADAVVGNGRLKGQKLAGGSFVSLELSFDAKTVLFAWTQAERTVDKWTPESTYHIFRADIDGTNLVQLTDGSWNDFDPCLLPDGRIVFVSERRGGYLRCSGAGGRPNPTYAMHVMNADGGDIRMLSYHETHEWQPSVDNNGMIAYTRWDYVDRDSDIAHHIWLTTPDGRDPRSYHGNYPDTRELRPWMEMSIRAVEDSHRYVAVSAPHHGQNYGSLVLIDQRRDDDNSMSQLKRITPDVMLPESESAPGVPNPRHAGSYRVKAEAYGTPWPLSEDYYLCVYDRGGADYGVYLVDSFGNRELIYRDPRIACLDPIPLRPRRQPPVIADSSDGDFPNARIAVMNVYDSDFTWPENTRIKTLRVIQLFPKATPREYEPNIGAGRQSLARGVLGTVPVEADGSAWFEAPAGVSLYFQAIDEHGLAVQTMRSDTYAHAGQNLVCQGCHEPKRRAVGNTLNGTPMALRRSPSVITPDVEGSYPVAYPVLVQDVLDRNCLACHSKDAKAPDLAADVSAKYGWSRSFQSLAKYAWAKHGGNGSIAQNRTSRSVAGDVGARASELYRMLAKGHYDLELSPEDMHRITLWLDCNSNFFGAYDNLDKQLAGSIIMPSLK